MLIIDASPKAGWTQAASSASKANMLTEFRDSALEISPILKLLFCQVPENKVMRPHNNHRRLVPPFHAKLKSNRVFYRGFSKPNSES